MTAPAAENFPPEDATALSSSAPSTSTSGSNSVPGATSEPPSGEGGAVLWFTGLSGAGKSTLSEALVPRLRAAGKRVEVLDGDVVRLNLSKGLGFSREDRDLNVARIAFVANLLARNGVVVVVAAVSPFRQARDEARRLIGPGFVEIHVAPPLEECIRRDVKGLYKKAISGEIAHFTGVSDPYEEPLAPEVRIDTSQVSIAQGLQQIEAYLATLAGLPGAGTISTAPSPTTTHVQ